MIAKTFSTFFCTAIKKFASFLANSGWAHPILNLHKPSEELPVSQRIHLNPQNHLLYSTVPFSNKFSDLACYSQPKKNHAVLKFRTSSPETFLSNSTLQASPARRWVMVFHPTRSLANVGISNTSENLHDCFVLSFHTNWYKKITWKIRLK